MNSPKEKAIGFANKFYTLWSINTEPVYTTDSNGKHWLTGHNTRYTYHKNISFDLEKAKELYPTLSVSEDLRGKTNSWVSADKKEDLCPHIMKFGKYYGRDVNELIEVDFQYLLWVLENRGYSSNGKYIQDLPAVQKHFQDIEDAFNEKVARRTSIFQSLLNVGSYEFVADKNLRVNSVDGIAYINIEIEEDMYIHFKFLNGTFTYNYYKEFTYGLPIIKGKAKRMKGKNVKFEFTEDTTDINTVIVHNVIIG
jgi:hypothetical protein